MSNRNSAKNKNGCTTVCESLHVSDRVEIRGTVSDEQKRELFGGALFTGMPSGYEGWGITAVEAASARRTSVPSPRSLADPVSARCGRR